MKTKRFASALLACLGLWQSVALAQDCGIYVEEESGAGLVFFDTGIAREYESSGTVRAVHQHYRNGDALFLRNVESGATEEYRFTADLGALKKVDTKWGEKVYTREEDYTYACAPVAALKPCGAQAGGKLVDAAVSRARAEGLHIVPACTYAKSVFDKTPAYHDVLAP